MGITSCLGNTLDDVADNLKNGFWDAPVPKHHGGNPKSWGYPNSWLVGLWLVYWCGLLGLPATGIIGYNWNTRPWKIKSWLVYFMKSQSKMDGMGYPP